MPHAEQHKLSQSVHLRIGRREPAQYRPTPIPQYQQNPLILALPRILSPQEAARQMSYCPALPVGMAQYPPEVRVHMLQAALQDWYQPTSGLIDLEQKLSRLIRGGYQARNPFSPHYQANREHDLQRLSTARVRPGSRSSTLSFRFIGSSGTGKTTGLETVLSLYPQIIDHTEFQSTPFHFTQLVWIHLDCPFDGSPRGLCLNFLEAVDNTLGTKYYSGYVTGRTNTDQLLMSMARVVRNHGLGVLALDEFQLLRDVRTAGAVQLMNFCVQLVNVLGVPIVFIGTPRAGQLFTRYFRQARRGTGQGATDWRPLPHNHPDWQVLLQSLFRYQVMDQPVADLAALGAVLHDESQGIVDIAVKIWKFAQWRGLAVGRPALTKQLIRSVAKDSLGEARRLLRAFREKRVHLEALDDLVIMDDDDFLRTATTQKEEALFQTLRQMLGAQQPPAPVGQDVPKTPDSEVSPELSQTQPLIVESAMSAHADPSAAPAQVDASPPTLNAIAEEAERTGQTVLQAFSHLRPLSDHGADNR